MHEPYGTKLYQAYGVQSVYNHDWAETAFDDYGAILAI